MKRLHWILFAALCTGSSPALAKWVPPAGTAPNPMISLWYSQQYNANKQWCCDKADGHDYYDDYTLNTDGSVTLSTGGKVITLPKYMVLTGSNPTGHAVWWYADTPSGHIDYCFSPGAGD
jgi:hypothetical protein